MALILSGYEYTQSLIIVTGSYIVSIQYIYICIKAIDMTEIIHVQIYNSGKFDVVVIYVFVYLFVCLFVCRERCTKYCIIF